MRPDTPLLRQVHPIFVVNGRVTSQAFSPTNKDQGKLSVDDGDKVTAEEAFTNYTQFRNLKSVGVLAVAVSECKSLELSVVPDPLLCAPSHMLIDFSKLSKKGKRNNAKRLKRYAEDRGWLYCPAERK